MKRIIKTIILPVLGVALIVDGFFYDVIFAGIPYQDPTPEIQARYDFHSHIAALVGKTGAIVFLLGIAAIPIILIKTKKKSLQMPDASERSEGPPGNE